MVWNLNLCRNQTTHEGYSRPIESCKWAQTSWTWFSRAPNRAHSSSSWLRSLLRTRKWHWPHSETPYRRTYSLHSARIWYACSQTSLSHLNRPKTLAPNSLTARCKYELDDIFIRNRNCENFDLRAQYIYL